MRRLLPSVALALAGVALFVALGGPAYAARAISGKDIKPKSITATQLADGAVTLTKVSAAARAAVRGATGPAGAAGSAGAKGPTGATGATGGLDVQDAQHRRIGRFAGFISTFVMVQLDSGALLAYDNAPGANFPAPLGASTVYFKSPACAGQGYASLLSPVQIGAIVASPPNPGSPVFVPRARTPVTFTSPSRLTSGGCTNSSTSASNVVPVDPGGTVPTVQKPLTILPVG